MGDHVPTTLRMRPTTDDGPVGTLRNLYKRIERLDKATHVSVDFAHGGQDVLQIIKNIYASPSTATGEPGNATDYGDRPPPLRDQRPQPSYGGGIKDVSLKLTDVKLLSDFRTLTLGGEAKATLSIATDYPPAFDSPTEILFKITSTRVSASQVGFTGSATMYKVLHGNFDIQLHYDNKVLVETIARFARKRNLSQADVERLLSSIKFDATAIAKIGFVPISFIKLSADSVLPMRRPVIGATDEALPIQLASMPGRSSFIAGAQVVPGGVFFDVPVPGFGLHYSRFGTRSGVSATAAGLAKPNLANFGQVDTFGYVDLHYARRVSKSVDLNVGITYTYSPSSDAENKPDSLQLQYLHARSKSWMPSSRDNVTPDADRSGHNFMFSIKGTFDLLGGH